MSDTRIRKYMMRKSQQRVVWRVVCLLPFVLGTAGCLDLTTRPSIPSDVINPTEFQTASGAQRMAVLARSKFQTAVAGAIVLSGLLSDEFNFVVGANSESGDGPDYFAVDSRNSIEQPVGSTNRWIAYRYGELHEARGYLTNAIDALRTYDSTVTPDLLGELLTMRGYMEIYLADVFCSGIPLSTLVFEGDYQYEPGRTTVEVYEHAIQTFDSVLTFVPKPNDNIRNFASMGKARALLALGRYADAADAAGSVPVGWTYSFSSRFGYVVSSGVVSSYFNRTQVSDHEGLNGFPFVTSGDSRVTVYQTKVSTSEASTIGYRPVKYRDMDTKPVPVIVASGTEAQLIVAEGELAKQEYGEWLRVLNDLRRSQSLTDLTDPGTDATRLKSQMDERAAWLFATGHRQGDLRRLVRNYGLQQDVVYPTGLYSDTYRNYGSHTNVAIPASERINPYFKGCLDRDA